MKIKELHIEKYKCFQEPITISFEDTLNGGILNRVLITGANGSGKTTLLELIKKFATFLIPNTIHPELMQSSGYLDLKLEPEEIKRIEFGSFLPIQSIIRFSTSRSYHLTAQGIYPQGKHINRESKSGDTVHLDQSTISLEQYIRLRNGNIQPDNWGGLVYLPHSRTFSGYISDRRTEETPRYQWISQVNSISRGPGSLYNYLRWLEDEDLRSIKYGPVQTHKFEEALNEINKLLIGKKIYRIDEQGNILVSLEGENNRHKIEELSSGEKQITLMLLEISRRCWPSSVLLIDEPEISLHPGMQADLLFMLEKFCKQRNIQLIMASHSETIFNLVHPHERRILSTLGQRAIKA